jgi:hypothetical protein
MAVGNIIRKRNCIIAVKQETTSGVDAWAGGQAVPATDCMRADVSIQTTQQQAQNTEMTGSLDDAPPIAAGTKGVITLTLMLRGSGTPATPPKFGLLMPLCGYIQTIQASAIAATAATAATASSVTLGAPYVATPQLYRGLPALLTGNPTAGAVTFIHDQPSLVANLATTFAPILSTATLVNIPPNVLYSPSSDPTLAFTGSVLAYIDGLAFRFTGCAGTWTVDLATAGAGTLKFTLTGTFVDAEAAAMPVNPTVDTGQPPILINNVARLGGSLVRISKATLDAGLTVEQPDNPEAVQGFDPSVITKRNSTGSIDPLMSVTDTVARMNNFMNGTMAPFAIGIGKTAGNRFGIVGPQAMITALSPADRNNVMSESISFDLTGSNSSLYLVQF